LLRVLVVLGLNATLKFIHPLSSSSKQPLLSAKRLKPNKPTWLVRPI